jgi:CRISPR-associated protein Cas5d
MALRRPSYRLWAHIEPWPGHEGETAAFDAQFMRRARAGKCFFQPYLGCREFPAYFELVEGDDAPVEPADIDLDLGYMLYDVFDLGHPGDAHDRPAISLFPARVTAGVLEVPPWHDESVLKVAQGGA